MGKDDTEILYDPLSDAACKEQQRKNRRFCVFGTLLITTVLFASLAYIYLVNEQIEICALSPEICEPLSPFTPEQLHLSLGAHDHEYYVTWSTMEPADTYLVWNRESSTVMQVIKGQRVDGHFDSDIKKGEKYLKYSYRAPMSVNLNTVYNYQVIACVNITGDDNSNTDTVCDRLSGEELIAKAKHSSKRYQIYTKPFDDPSRELNMIFYGDLGLLNAQSVPRLTKEVELNDLIIHNGDFAYDLNTQNGKYGDRFMRLIEPIAARIPYQTSVGNHEIAGNFSEYNHRFTMINRGKINYRDQNNFFYSFNAGPVHFVAISTEFYYFFDSCGPAPINNQYNWLIEDLKHASSSDERSKRPWIIVFGHRPMYCSSRYNDDCSKENNILRKGMPVTGQYALEKLFYDFGVDVEIYSHEHQYERFLPIYDGNVYNGSIEAPYHNPGAPIHIISGSAGCEEKLDPFTGHPAPGSIKRISDYGYTHLKASKCQLEFKQVSDDQEGTVVDHFVVSKKYQHNFPDRGDLLPNC